MITELGTAHSQIVEIYFCVETMRRQEESNRIEFVYALATKHRGLSVSFCWVVFVTNKGNTSLAAPGALAHCLQNPK